MAKYSVEMGCGHTEEIALFGPTKERQRKIEYLGQHGQCESCKQAARDAANAKAAEESKSAGLPALTGSEKQISWAESIRAAKMTELAELEALAAQSNGSEAQKQQLAAALATIRATDQAAWWIENRDATTRAMAATILRAK